jgi:tetratricopeptide (TPR) repeat protein
VTGLLGLSVALAGLALLFARPAPAGTPPVVRGVAQGALAGLAALAAHSTVDFNLRIPSNAALAALLLAAAAAGAGYRRQAAPRLAAGLLAILSLALLTAAARAPEAPWLAARLELQAAAQATLGEARRLRLERAEAELRRALELRPAQAESWLLLAHTERALGRRDRARVLASRALELDPQRTGLAEAVARISAEPLASPRSGDPPQPVDDPPEPQP